jgi:hypothetical protein
MDFSAADNRRNTFDGCARSPSVLEPETSTSTNHGTPSEPRLNSCDTDFSKGLRRYNTYHGPPILPSITELEDLTSTNHGTPSKPRRFRALSLVGRFPGTYDSRRKGAMLPKPADRHPDQRESSGHSLLEALLSIPIEERVMTNLAFRRMVNSCSSSELVKTIRQAK